MESPFVPSRLRPDPPKAIFIEEWPRPITTTDMIAGFVAIAILQSIIGALASQAASSAAVGVAVGLVGFLVILAIVGGRHTSSARTWLAARKLARTNLELAAMGDTEVSDRELCEALLVRTGCTRADTSPLRRRDLDGARTATHRRLPRLWVIGKRIPPLAPADFSDAELRVPCSIHRESLGRESTTFVTIRTGAIALLAIITTLAVVRMGPAMCCPALVVFVVIGLLLPTKRVSFDDRELVVTREGLGLALTPSAIAAREKMARRKRERPEDPVGPDGEPFEQHHGMESAAPDTIVLPWREAYAIVSTRTEPRTMGKPQQEVLHWRVLVPQSLWEALGVGGPYVIEFEHVHPEQTPWAESYEAMDAEV